MSRSQPKRYPLAPLFEAMGMTPNRALTTLGVSGSVQRKYRTEGVSEKTAELFANRIGCHVFELWPEMADDRIADVERACEECGELFLPTRKGHRFCSVKCGRRAYGREWARRKYHEDPEYRAAARERSRRAHEAAKGSPSALRASRVRRRLWAERNPERARAAAAERARRRYWSDPEYRAAKLARDAHYRAVRKRAG